jgi:ornithine cyclodeaminase/alanine dehydrogenase-like protein (mu-crystallin family)
MPATPDVLIITRADIAKAMSQADWLDAAERAFRAAAEGRANSPHPLHLPGQRGGFHVKAASMSLKRDYVAVKVNGNFPANPDEFGLPTVQGAIVLADGSNGVLLAIIDSIEVTLRRTAAASALAAKLLARPESSTMLVCGCGAQGRAHVAAMREVLPVTRLLFWDRAAEAAEALARDCEGEVATDLRTAAQSAEVIACCTPSTEPFLHPDMVGPGTFIAAVGADNPDKSEIAPELMARARVVADSLEQCKAMGDLHHAIAAGAMADTDVHAELADVLPGAAEGRRSPDEIIVFDSTGTGLLDVAASAAIYERASRDGLGQPVGLGEEVARGHS